MRYEGDINVQQVEINMLARQWLSGQRAWIALEKCEFETGKAQIFFFYYYTGVVAIRDKAGNIDIMRYQHDRNIEHNMKIGRAAVAQWTTRLTRTGQTRVLEKRKYSFITLPLITMITWLDTITVQNTQLYYTSTVILYTHTTRVSLHSIPIL